MASFLARTFTATLAFAYGLFNLILYGCIACKRGTFFKRSTEKEKLELQLAQDRLWNLSKDFSGLSHHILTLRSGFKFHFVSNHAPGSPEVQKSSKPLVIFIHGFPDSWAMWRHLISSSALQDAAALVAVDLPGFGASDSLDKYSATNVLEQLTEFIVTIRAQYGVDDGNESNKKRTIVAAHDWGCVLAMRLAAEAPSLADRFMLSNGPLVHMVMSNIQRLVSSARKMFNTALRSPLQSRTPLLQAFRTLGPLFRQISLSGYIFAMQLPPPFVEYFLTGGNYSFIKEIHKGSYGQAEFTPRDAAECMATSMGPSAAELETQTVDGETYPTVLQAQHPFARALHMASYYRDDTSVARWRKSVETVASLHGLAGGDELRRSSSGAGMFDEGAPGVLKASATVFWGQKDIALNRQICLDGMADYLVPNSQVVLLPRSGHWTPVEEASRAAWEKAIQWAIGGEQGDIEAAVRVAYPDAKVTVRK
ncbi:hypothetical protein NUU61_009171 [Penicillium alfredii]|uniref:AB hydrolase-1 domain-containing protein n=1 Tax=Penicillium alfredii TaxID=1506179 RepID=A0A9W9EMM4_9EURO|nr:uncharacterized protein NUU61_009171 [Penicillium alfredii]KAJ5084592.1 hypothetical protein NUU61_009171 [Penicillium alfredii]